VRREIAGIAASARIAKRPCQAAQDNGRVQNITSIVNS